jgi:hypothetical protein
MLSHFDEQYLRLMEPEEIRLVGRADAALTLGDVSSSLAILISTEQSIAKKARSNDQQYRYLEASAILWLRLKRAFVLMQSFHLREALAIVADARTDLQGRAEVESLDFSQWIEDAWVTMLVARINTLLGNYSEAIVELQRLAQKLLLSSEEEALNVGRETKRLIESVGEILGYRRVSLRLGSGGSREIFGSASDRWNDQGLNPSPVSFGSKINREFVEKYMHFQLQVIWTVTSRFDEYRSNVEEICELMDDWRLSEPFSVEVRVIRVHYSSLLLSTRLALDSYAEFDEIWTTELNEIVELLDETDECVDARRQMCEDLTSLARDILHHRFTSEDLAKEFFLIASTMLGLSYALLDESEPVTQAIALAAIEVSSAMYDAYDLGAQHDLARWQHERRDAILSELLSRDPENDRARFIAERQPISGADSVVLAEVKSWNWDITALIS